MRKRIVLCTLLLALAGCGSRDVPGSPSAGETGQSEPEVVEQPSSQMEQPGEECAVNTAVTKIALFSDMPAEAAGGVQLYGTEMCWMEANQISGLERYLPMGGGEYFLIVPQYIHSAVVVETLDWGDGSEPKVTGTTYENKDTPDDYALLLDAATPEGIPGLRVTITGGDLTGTYYFSYNGRGFDRPELVEGLYCTQFGGFADAGESSSLPESSAVERPYPDAAADLRAEVSNRPGFQAGAGAHDRGGLFFVEHNPDKGDTAVRVEYAIKLPYEWTKEFQYPDSEYGQYFFTGEYLVRFEGYYWDGSPLTSYLSFPDSAEKLTLGTKEVWFEQLQSGDSRFREYIFPLEEVGCYVKVVLAPYLHSVTDTPVYTQSIEELDESVRQMISSFYVTAQIETKRPF